MLPPDYRTYVNRLCLAPPLRDYRGELLALELLDMDQRSAVAKLCRAQCYPPNGVRLDRMTKCLPPYFRDSILPLCQTPLMAGLVLHLVLLAPMSQREIERIYTESMVKELTVMESVKRTCTLSFEAFFGYPNMPLLDFLPPNRAMALNIQECIDKWADSLQGTVLYPRLGSKTVSKVTRDELRGTVPEYVQASDIGVTPIDLERVYDQFGIKIGGPCEMRQKWYCSNLKPRTYYACGGDAFHTSKYLALPLVDLCDTLPPTNKYSRVDPGRIAIRDESDDVVYYDLTSFTSNFHVHYEFMLRLAQYCEGVNVVILDARLGMIDKDLGELIREYADMNLRNPTYTLPSKYADPSVLHYHSVAGFLGVYGNIASATFIHGSVMTMMHDYFDENNVAGDDGLDVSEDVDTTLRVVGSLGIVVDGKTFRDSEGCCIHLKRPITRVGSRLLHGLLSTWPSLEPVMEQSDPRYPYYNALTRRERRDTLAGTVASFLRKLEPLDLTNDDADLVDAVLSYIYDTYGLPRSGCVPQATRERSAFVPTYEKRFIGMDPIYNTIVRNYSGIAKLPKRGYVKWNRGMLEHGTFECNSNRLLNYLEALGYLEQEKVSQFTFGEEGLRGLLHEYTSPEPPIYRYTVVRRLPLWFSDFNV